MLRRPLVIVGAGPAGMSAAITAAEFGLTPMIIDENATIGGQIYRQRAPSNGNPDNRGSEMTARRGADLLRRFRRHSDQIELSLETKVWGLFSERRLTIVRRGQPEMVEAEYVIVAPGAYEYVPPFPGWTLPGVITPGGAQALVKTMKVAPGRRILLAGTGPFLLVVALALHAAGVEVVGVAEAVKARELVSGIRDLVADGDYVKQGLRLVYDVARAGITVHRGHVVVEARGDDEIREAIIAPCDDSWRPNRSRAWSVPVDTLCVGYGFVPRTQLVQLAGCRMRFDNHLGGWIPQVDDDFETSTEGVFAVGDGGGVAGALSAEIEGAIAALAVARRLDSSDSGLQERRRGELYSRLANVRRFRSALDRVCAVRPGLAELAADDTVVCRCEDLTRGEIDTAIAFGGSDIRTLKVMTRLGMGSCQGANCWTAACRHVAAQTGLPIEDVGPLSVRAPVGLVTLGELAGDAASGSEAVVLGHEE